MLSFHFYVQLFFSFLRCFFFSKNLQNESPLQTDDSFSLLTFQAKLVIFVSVDKIFIPKVDFVFKI